MSSSIAHRLLPAMLLSLLPSLPVVAQSWVDGLQADVELQCTTGSGQTPLWLQANRYGLTSHRSENGLVRGVVERPMGVDRSHTWRPGEDPVWDVAYGIDLAVGYGQTSTLMLQQCYAAARYMHAVLTVGQQAQPSAWLDDRLSSGAQTLGINARPVPGVRLELPHYYYVPGTGGWLGVRGHVAYGMLTDGAWQERWTGGEQRYATGVMLHTKAGYLRIGPERKSLSVELGLEMACQYGGTMYHTAHGTVEGTAGWRGAWQALTASGSDEVDATYHNVGGNQLGSWVARVSYDRQAWRVSIYADHFFEDHSAMFHLDYDGYGQGADWNTRQQSRYLLYPLRDMLWGVEVELKHCPWLSHIVVEYLDTRYQSGPIYHDHNPGLSDHIGGDDNYYNHYLYQGWSHWGQVMGNALYRSPLANADHTLTVQDNRFYAWHGGLTGGLPTWGIAYRVLCSWQQGYGTYQSPLLHPQRNLSVMAELTYSPQRHGVWHRCQLRAALGIDRGDLLGDNTGVQVGVIYRIKE